MTPLYPYFLALKRYIRDIDNYVADTLHPETDDPYQIAQASISLRFIPSNALAPRPNIEQIKKECLEIQEAFNARGLDLARVRPT